MPTRLPRGKSITRAVPSKAHDARGRGELVVSITGTGGGAVIELRPLGRRVSYSVMVDDVYDWAVKRAVDLERRERAKKRKAR